MTMDPQFLHQPLLPSLSGDGTTTTPIPSTRNIVFRLLSVLLLGLISIFANLEASKGFNLTIINAAGDTPSGRRFDLLFMSNDKISRLVLEANDLVQTILSHTKNDFIHRVIVRFTSEKLVEVCSEDGHEFVINISSSVLEETDDNFSVYVVMARAVVRAMTKIWLWNDIRHGQNLGPCLVDGIVESIAMFSGFHPGGDTGLSSSPGCYEEEVRKVANMLHHCEVKEKGFIGRLIRVLSDKVDDPTVDDDDDDDEMGLNKRVEHLLDWCNATDLLSLSNY